MCVWQVWHCSACVMSNTWLRRPLFVVICSLLMLFRIILVCHFYAVHTSVWLAVMLNTVSGKSETTKHFAVTTKIFVKLSNVLHAQSDICLCQWCYISCESVVPRFSVSSNCSSSSKMFRISLWSGHTIAPFTRYSLLSNRLDNWLYRVYSQLSIRLYNVVWQPVERTVAVRSTRLSNRVWQPVISCKWGICNHPTNSLYENNQALLSVGIQM